MFRTRTAASSFRATCLILAIVAANDIGASRADAQEVRMSVASGLTIGGGAAGSRPAMSTRDLKNYGDMLEFDEAQREAAAELLNAYQLEFEAASDQRAKKIKELSEEFQETQDHAVWQQMAPISEAFSKRSAELETALLNDIKTLCTEKQLAHWPKLERTRRRERTLDRGVLSGESVDLVAIVSKLELKDETKKSVDEQLSIYELDLDKALTNRNKVLDEQTTAFTPGASIALDLEKMQKQHQANVEAGSRVREVNQRYTRAVEGLLPEDLRARFLDEVKRASFPSVYKPTKSQRALEAAAKFDDLNASQREAIQSLRAIHEQEIATLNEKWAAAITKEELDGSNGFSGGGMTIMIATQNDNERPTNEARRARYAADRKTMQNLESLLTAEQRERLPRTNDENIIEVGGFRR